jgi:hypothetical protein
MFAQLLDISNVIWSWQFSINNIYKRFFYINFIKTRLLIYFYFNLYYIYFIYIIMLCVLAQENRWGLWPDR